MQQQRKEVISSIVSRNVCSRNRRRSFEDASGVSDLAGVNRVNLRRWRKVETVDYSSWNLESLPVVYILENIYNCERIVRYLNIGVMESISSTTVNYTSVAGW